MLIVEIDVVRLQTGERTLYGVTNMGWARDYTVSRVAFGIIGTKLGGKEYF